MVLAVHPLTQQVVRSEALGTMPATRVEHPHRRECVDARIQRRLDRRRAGFRQTDVQVDVRHAHQSRAQSAPNRQGTEDPVYSGMSDSSQVASGRRSALGRVGRNVGRPGAVGPAATSAGPRPAPLRGEATGRGAIRQALTRKERPLVPAELGHPARASHDLLCSGGSTLALEEGATVTPEQVAVAHRQGGQGSLGGLEQLGPGDFVERTVWLAPLREAGDRPAHRPRSPDDETARRSALRRGRGPTAGAPRAAEGGADRRPPASAAGPARPRTGAAPG